MPLTRPKPWDHNECTQTTSADYGTTQAFTPPLHSPEQGVIGANVWCRLNSPGMKLDKQPTKNTGQ